MRAAFLDMNGTLMRGEPGIELINGLYEGGRCRRDDYDRVQELMVRYRRQELSNEAIGEKMFVILCAVVAGLTMGEVMGAYLPRYDARIGPSIFPYSRSLIARLHAAGCRAYATTNVPHPLLDPLMKDMDIEAAIAPEMECVNGRFTDRLLNWNWSEKVKGEGVLATAQREGIDLRESYAFGDGEGDASYLSLVGHPVAVNPSPQLEAIAKERGWAIVRRVDDLSEVSAALGF